MHVLSRITSFKHGWWFWTVALKKPSIWQFSHCTFTKASPLPKLPGVWGSDLVEGKKSEIKGSWGTVLIWTVHFFFSPAISLFRFIPRLSRKCGKCKSTLLLSSLGTEWKLSWPQPTQLLLKVVVFSAKNYLQAAIPGTNWSAQFILLISNHLPEDVLELTGIKGRFHFSPFCILLCCTKGLFIYYILH